MRSIFEIIGLTGAGTEGSSAVNWGDGVSLQGGIFVGIHERDVEVGDDRDGVR